VATGPVEAKPWLTDLSLPRPYDSGRIAEYRQQLGQDPRTAAFRLGRQLLLEYARRLGLADCLRCGKPIEPGAQFDLDHEKPWIDSDDPKGLYWDLDNVRLSHPICNRKAQRTNVARRGPDGTWLCLRCRRFKPEGEFYTLRNGKGRQPYCKPCNIERVGEWRIAAGRRGGELPTADPALETGGQDER
jgi:hypothetical protein